MIMLVVVPGHEYTLRSIVEGTYGFPTPKLQVANYERLFRARQVPRATYIFGDIERLSAWELRLAADAHGLLTACGLRCLNKPALAMSRVELLGALHAAGINPFRAWRGDERPKPTRFPVFLRGEFDHMKAIPQLIATQKQLVETLRALQTGGVPLRGILVVELCAKPYSQGLWHKWGSYRVGDRYSVDHIGVDDTWLVKYGAWDKLTDAAVNDEYDAVVSNRFAADLKRAFEIAHIEFGRADHATIGGRTVIYEINTNPFIGHYVPDPKPVRFETQKHARMRLAACLEEIDTAETGTVEIGTTGPLKHVQSLPAFFMTPRL